MRQYKISNVFQQTPRVNVIQLDPLQGEELSFLPGQYIDVSFANDPETLADKYKSFSISSSPLKKESLEIVVLGLGKFRHKLYNALPGTVLNINGPYGKFVYSHNSGRISVFIAGGSGIAPVMSILRYVNKRHQETPYVLFYTCKTKNDIIFFNELNDIKNSNKELEYHLLTTGDVKLGPGHGGDSDLFIDKIASGKSIEYHESGYINESMIVSNIDDIPSKIYYICGPYEMTVMVNFLLLKLGVDSTNIKSELW